METDLIDPPLRAPDKALALTEHPVMRAQRYQSLTKIPKQRKPTKGKLKSNSSQGGIKKYLLRQGQRKSGTSNESADESPVKMLQD